jgi:hypothetical protein
MLNQPLKASTLWATNSPAKLEGYHDPDALFLRQINFCPVPIGAFFNFIK